MEAPAAALRTPSDSATRSGVKRVALAAAVVGAALVTVLLPSLAGGSTSDVRVNCKASAIDVYFWPHGHPVVPAYKFASYPPAHLEVYRRGSPASKNFFVFLSGTAFNYANTCDLATSPAATTWGGGPKKTVAATRRVRCGFGAVVQLKLIPLGGTSRLAVVRGSSTKEVLTATIKKKGSTLTYDSRYCRAAAVPGVR
jgi:hypothetical protein